MVEIKCPVCGNNAKNAPSSESGQFYECPRCGIYFTSMHLYNSFFDKLNEFERVLLSGFLANNNRYVLNRTEFEKIRKHKMPSLIEKANSILLLLAKNFPIAGTQIPFDEKEDKNLITSIKGKCYIINEDEWFFIRSNYLSNQTGFLDGDKSHISITPAGWEYIREIQEKNPSSKTAFIAMWFDEKVHPIRDTIKTAISNAGYEPVIVNEEPFNDDITDKIITLIKRSRFVIADLTGQRGGVYYESGFARGLNLPVIYTVKEDEIDKVHFDINHQNFLLWKEGHLDKFQKALTNKITATIGDGPNLNKEGEK